MTREAYANGNAFLGADRAGERLWDRVWTTSGAG